jgi:hypothetical protein
MQRVIFGCVTLLFLTSPISAQQAPADQTMPDQSVPPLQSPPASSQQSSDLPPFIPPPRARLYDNYRPAAHHHAGANHRSTRHRRGSAHHHATRRHHVTHRVAHLSKRTIHRCHSMTFNQIVRHSSCLALMRQELKARGRRHHHATHHSRSARHHRPRHRNRR